MAFPFAPTYRNFVGLFAAVFLISAVSQTRRIGARMEMLVRDALDELATRVARSSERILGNIFYSRS
jgi:hypothetical protein